MSSQARLLAALIALSLGTGINAQERSVANSAIAIAELPFQRTLNGAERSLSVSGNVATITSGAKTDFFREPDGSAASGNAPVVLTRIDNTRPFTFSSRIEPTLVDTYDAGALYLWVGETRWLKMALERDERGLSRVVTVRTEGTSDDNNHDVIEAKSAHFKISSDTRSIGFYYSVDGETWQLVRVFRNDYPPELWLGLSAQSPIGKGNTARFDKLSLTERSVTDFRMGK